MRIMIVSDTHGKHKYLERALERVKFIDRMIHLGDVEGCEDYIEAIAGCEVEFVAGNNDFYSDLPHEIITEIGPYRALLTHGHYYYVNSGMSDLICAGREKGVDLVMYGHTHRPTIDYEENLILVNPGSLTYPRQEGHRPSYIMLELDDADRMHFDTFFL
ncbi:MAG: metallophosphoesterase [Eubacterium sp.]|nr:metallophosphoesterase [Eubacterium sp.]